MVTVSSKPCNSKICAILLLSHLLWLLPPPPPTPPLDLVVTGTPMIEVSSLSTWSPWEALTMGPAWFPLS